MANDYLETEMLYPFLQGGGEMGELIRAFNWSENILGSPDQWPAALKIAVAMVLGSPFPMHITWGEQFIQIYNDGYRPVLGAIKHPDALGSPIYKSFPEIWDTVGPMFHGVMEGRAVRFPVFKLYLERNGFREECYFDFAYSPIRDENGIVQGVLTNEIEITEQKQDEVRKNDFIGMVSHELKTPLTSLNAILQVLNIKLKRNEDAFVPSAIEKANIQVKRMSAMINGFLNISRLESGKIFIEKRDFEIDQLIMEMIEEAELTTSTHHVNFTRCGETIVSADRDKISSVITNLISNAVKYSPKGKLITVVCESNGKEVTVSVKDEGMGIKPQDVNKVFDRYYRIETKHTQHISGFGIGLYLSAEIIKRHDGQIWAESEIGKGSTFSFTLPLKNEGIR